MKILVAQGVGDALWALPKVAAIARRHGSGHVDLRVACWDPSGIESRAISLLERFPVVRSCAPYLTPRTWAGAILQPGDGVGTDGIYLYQRSGPTIALPDVRFIAVPNEAVDRGIRLEEWLPEYEADWTVFDGLRLNAHERVFAAAVAADGPFAVFYMSSLLGNGLGNGWNRGPLWTPDDWIELGRRLHKALGVRIVVVGAAYDLGYWTQQIAPRVADLPYWSSLIGQCSLPTTAAVLRRARCVVSYPSGIAVLAHYLRRPTCMFVRAHGDSIEAGRYVSPADGLATAWLYPGTKPGAFLVATYGQTTPADIERHARREGW